MANINIGRILPIFKGDYNSTTQYEKLDIVYYQGSSYVAKNSVKGIVPTDDTRWQLVSKQGESGADSEEFQNLVNYTNVLKETIGGQSVGNDSYKLWRGYRFDPDNPTIRVDTSTNRQLFSYTWAEPLKKNDEYWLEITTKKAAAVYIGFSTVDWTVNDSIEGIVCDNVYTETIAAAVTKTIKVRIPYDNAFIYYAYYITNVDSAHSEVHRGFYELNDLKNQLQQIGNDFYSIQPNLQELNDSKDDILFSNISIDNNIKFEDAFAWDGSGQYMTFAYEATTITAGANTNYVVFWKDVHKGDILSFEGTTDIGKALRIAYMVNPNETPQVGSQIDFQKSFGWETETKKEYFKVLRDGRLIVYRHLNNWSNYHTKIGKFSGGEGGTVEGEDKYLSLIAQAKYVGTSPETQSLGILHYTDIHGDEESKDEILKCLEKYKPYINDLVNTGDATLYYSSDIGWYTGSGLADKSLFVLGNHDAATKAATQYDQVEGSAAWDGEGQTWCYDTLFAPYASKVGEVMAGTNQCYWHKDYADQKIRMIGIDCMHRFDGTLNPDTGAILTAGLKHLTNEQELWLLSKLNETLNSSSSVYGYSVVFLCHYPLDDYADTYNATWDDTTHRFTYNTGSGVLIRKDGVRTNFNNSNATFSATQNFGMRNRVDNGYSTGAAYPNYKKGSVNNIGDIIQKWIQRGGKYIAWICGHTHTDYFYYPTKYPEMLVICNNQAGYNRGSGGEDRNNGLPRMCANYISFDTQNGLIKIVRLGLHYNRVLKEMNYTCYNYLQRQISYEG